MVGGMTNNAKDKSQRKAPFFCLFGDPHLHKAFPTFAPRGEETPQRGCPSPMGFNLSLGPWTRPLTLSHNPECLQVKIEAMTRARSPKDLLVHSSYFIDDKTGIQVRAWLAGGHMASAWRRVSCTCA